jgi:hypothetical protein
MRVLVCGGRDFNNRLFLAATLDSIGPITCLIHGGAPGADTLAANWADSMNIPVELHLADWKKYGLAAGPRRNAEMLAKGKPDLVVAFPGGKGTADMVRRAKAKGVPVKEIGVVEIEVMV